MRGHPSRGQAELFESQLASIFSSDQLQITREPAKADLFFHPACLVTAFFQIRSTIVGRGSRVAAIRALRAIEAAVLMDIADLGYAAKPHIINTLRCRKQGDPTLAPLGDLYAFHEYAYPILWGAACPSNRSMATFCPEAPGPVHATSVHVPYCQPAVPTPPLRYNRSISALFIGSEGRVWWHHSGPNGSLVGESQRRGWLDALKRTPRSKALIFRSRDGREFLGWGSENASGAQLRELMADANFTMCPRGDAPDTQRIYTAISQGSIPLLDDTFQPPPLVAWDNFSLPLRYQLRFGQSARHHAGIKLPEPAATDRLLRNVWSNAKAFECVPGNPLIVRYLQRELARIATMPDGMDPLALQRAASGIDRGYAECRRRVHTWTEEQGTLGSAKRLLDTLECFVPPMSRTTCGCCHSQT